LPPGCPTAASVLEQRPWIYGQSEGLQQGTAIYFSIVAKLPEFEEFLTAKSKKSKKEA
jgi:hypothetical protein